MWLLHPSVLNNIYLAPVLKLAKLRLSLLAWFGITQSVIQPSVVFLIM